MSTIPFPLYNFCKSEHGTMFQNTTYTGLVLDMLKNKQLTRS